MSAPASAATTPRVLVFGGPNGSGKSTLIAQVRQDPSFGFPELYINADDLAREMPDIDTTETRARQAFHVARALRKQYREQQVSFAFETVFSHPSGLLDLMRLKQAGYETAFFFVATAAPSINLERVRQRVLSGGHDVPEDKVRSRYERSLRFLVRAAETADQTYVLDNSEQLQLVGTVVQGQLQSAPFPLPEYLHTYLAIPFSERQIVPLPRTHLNLLVSRPDEKQGVSVGPLISVNHHYALQQVSTEHQTHLLLHDRLLLTQSAAQGQHSRITYQDGYGHVTPASHEQP